MTQELIIGIVLAVVGTLLTVVGSIFVYQFNGLLKKTKRIDLNIAVMKMQIIEALKFEKKIEDHTVKINFLQRDIDVMRDTNKIEKKHFFDKLRAIESKH